MSNFALNLSYKRMRLSSGKKMAVLFRAAIFQ